LRFQIPWHWPLVIALTLYLVSAVSVFASRVGYERRRRLIARIEEALGRRTAAPSDDVAPGDAHVFAGVSPAQARRLPFEHRVSRDVNEALARFLVATLGPDRMRGTAARSGRRGSRWTRIAALRLLALARAHEAISLLDAATRDGDEEVVAAAVATLGRIPDPEAARALVAVLESNRFAPSRVATFLDRFPLDVPDVLRPLLAGAAPTARYWGAVLARRYHGVAWLEDVLVRLAHDPAPVVRKGAVQSLAALGAADGVLVAAGALTDPIWYVRAHGARALGELRASGHAQAVASLLADPEWWVRQAAKDALVSMGEGAEEAVMACLSHADRFARNSAAEVLQNSGAFERLLIREITSPSMAHPEALRLMQRAGGRRLAEAVIDRLPSELRSRAAAALASLDEPEVSL
jgi:HEAT repeat protein